MTPDIRRAALARLRYEQAAGIDFVPRQELAAPVIQQPLKQEQPAISAPPPVISQSGPLNSDKETRWANLEARALACTKCVLHRERQNVVFGTGDRNAKLLFVGEGPGADEDAQGVPFVGRAGQLLNKIIAAMKLEREQVYICNVVKCRPPGNRTPLPDEIGACSPFLNEQIELVSPKVIVSLGAPATKTLLNISQGIMSVRGRWFAYKGIPVMPTYHPAFVLRAYTEENRRAVWEDMKKVIERLAGS